MQGLTVCECKEILKKLLNQNAGVKLFMHRGKNFMKIPIKIILYEDYMDFRMCETEECVSIFQYSDLKDLEYEEMFRVTIFRFTYENDIKVALQLLISDIQYEKEVQEMKKWTDKVWSQSQSTNGCNTSKKN